MKRLTEQMVAAAERRAGVVRGCKAAVAAPIAVDLFAGCGGLTLGLKKAGFRVLGAVELDELAADTYSLNHPEVHLWREDVRSIPAARVARTLHLKRGDLDLLAGGPPCQGFSTLRTRNGRQHVRDSRNALVDEFVRFVSQLRPKVVLLENVPGLASTRRMKQLLKGLRDLRYHVDADVLDAADYGVPQRRRRVIVLASRRDGIGFPRVSRVRRTVWETIGHLPRPAVSRDPLHAQGEKRDSRIRELISQIPKNGGSRSDLGARRQLRCHRKLKGFHDVYGRMSWDDVSPTITGGCVNPSKGRFLHPRQNRCITLREAALLQTFPARYRFERRKGKFAVAQMIGNALPPEFVKQHANMIRQHLYEAYSKKPR